MPVVRLKPGREKSIQRRHPWLFSGAIGDIQGNPADGESVQIVDSRGEFLAWGAYSSSSQIMVRIWSWKQDEVINTEFFRTRLDKSISRRTEFVPGSYTNSLRLVHAESDGLPGLIVDRYNDTLVVQLLSCGVEYWRETIVNQLVELTGAARIYERSDVEVRRLENLSERTGLLWGTELPGPIQIFENELNYWVNIAGGQKTGFYLDQRLNRQLVRKFAVNRDVLDCFAYTGGFTTNALYGSAKSVTAIESSGDSIKLSKENVILNKLPIDRVDWIEGDVFHELRRFRDMRMNFDMIILDPPKFAHTSSQVERAARGYKDINLLALKLLRQDGLLVTFSCSGGISVELFQKIVAGAALDAGVEAQIVARMQQDADHPVELNFPEGQYLKGLVIQVVH